MPVPTTETETHAHSATWNNVTKTDMNQVRSVDDYFEVSSSSSGPSSSSSKESLPTVLTPSIMRKTPDVPLYSKVNKERHLADPAPLARQPSVDISESIRLSDFSIDFYDDLAEDTRLVSEPIKAKHRKHAATGAKAGKSKGVGPSRGVNQQTDVMAFTSMTLPPSGPRPSGGTPHPTKRIMTETPRARDSSAQTLERAFARYAPPPTAAPPTTAPPKGPKQKTRSSQTPTGSLSRIPPPSRHQVSERGCQTPTESLQERRGMTLTVYKEKESRQRSTGSQTPPRAMDDMFLSYPRSAPLLHPIPGTPRFVHQGAQTLTRTERQGAPPKTSTLEKGMQTPIITRYDGQSPAVRPIQLAPPVATRYGHQSVTVKPGQMAPSMATHYNYQSSTLRPGQMAPPTSTHYSYQSSSVKPGQLAPSTTTRYNQQPLSVYPGQLGSSVVTRTHTTMTSPSPPRHPPALEITKVRQETHEREVRGQQGGGHGGFLPISPTTGASFDEALRHLQTTNKHVSDTLELAVKEYGSLFDTSIILIIDAY